MRPIGFSTGAVALSDFKLAIERLRPLELQCIELSALRMCEIEPLLNALPALDLRHYSFVSMHAPSSYLPDEEGWLSELLYHSVPEGWSIVLHPDAIHKASNWNRFGSRVAIENMDRRKNKGRNVLELQEIFSQLPAATMCLDLGHARQCDSTMTEAYLMLRSFAGRITQLHLSEVNTESRHDRISYSAKLAFRQIASHVPEKTPVILESRVGQEQLASEVESAREALQARGVLEYLYV